MKCSKAHQILTLSVAMLVVVGCGTTSTIAPSVTPPPTPSSTNSPEPTFTPVPASPPLVPSPETNSAEWQDQIIYALIPQIFYDGNPDNNYMQKKYQLPNPHNYEGGFRGGDIAGIRMKMHYLKGLGITSVLLNPVLHNDEDPDPIFSRFLATGYRVRDFQKIDPNFGTNEEFSQLIAEFHADTNEPRINIILDLPFSVTGAENPWVNYSSFYRPWDEQNEDNNIGCNRQSGYCSPIELPDGTRVDNDFTMPMLNHTQGMDTDSGVYGVLKNDVVFWLTDHFEIDGFRYDSAHNFYPAFWPKLMNDFQDRYAETRPRFWHIAEVGIPQKSWQIPPSDFVNQTVSKDVDPIIMDSVYDFGLTSYIKSVFAKGLNPNCIPAEPFPCVNLLDHLVNTEVYKNPERLMATIDFYDLSFLKEVPPEENPIKKIYLASAFLLTINRVPLINSGNEYAIDYTEPGRLFGGVLDEDYHTNFKELIRIRREHAAFRRGTLTPLYSDFSSTVISYARHYEDQTFIVILNNASVSQSMELRLGENGITCSNVENLLVDNDQGIQLINPDESNNSLSLTLSPWEAKIVRCG